jgi:hypothetical protein
LRVRDRLSELGMHETASSETGIALR